MAQVEIKVREGGITKIKLGFNIPNKIVDLWEEDKRIDSLLELNYEIIKHFQFIENKHRREKDK